MAWDPACYEAFQEERQQPFLDLLAMVPTDLRPKHVIDVGCGTGRTTRLLAERYPNATIVGVDRSEAMLARAHGPANVSFEVNDLRTWSPDVHADLIVANAVLHWLPEPARAIERLVGWLTEDGCLAFQVPANFHARSHRIVAEVAAEDPWAPRLEDVAAGTHVLPLAKLWSLLSSLPVRAQVQERRYAHELPAPDGVFAWLSGTTLVPYVECLVDDGQRERFLERVRERLRIAYPPQGDTVRYLFARQFVVARRRPPGRRAASRFPEQA